MNNSFMHKLFSFRFVSICGMIIALYIFSIKSESQGLLSFLFDWRLYGISALIAVGLRLIWWLAVDKGTFYEFSRLLRQMVEDSIIINLVVLCTLSFLFLLTSFL